MCIVSFLLSFENGNVFNTTLMFKSVPASYRGRMQWALDIAEKRKPWSSPLIEQIGSQSEAQQIIEITRRKLIENGPLHQACLEVVEEFIVHGGHLGIGMLFDSSCSFFDCGTTVYDGVIGKNIGKGYYIYEKGRGQKLMEESRKLANLMPQGKLVRQKCIENGPLHQARSDIVEGGIVDGGHLGVGKFETRSVVQK
ncbi:enoyl-CoA hydratase/isomerase family [Artemisia annua]|uniref:Enoyl-CoA hydratase/isomerase family n=1 Tax=Artemisia annua TaxID=35608 RepID=A0A2U1N5G6_ARTAN|nr:enoyl-CoA hydratase/isomerase family [Artemisia annua]